MTDGFKSPVAWMVLLCLGGIVLGQLFTLVGLARGDKRVREEAAKWGKALGGGVAGRQQSEAQMDDLHRAVARLKAQPKSEDPRAEDE